MSHQIRHIADEDKIEVVTSIDYMNQILEKIKSGDDASVENSGRRPIRELLQNSDDAEANLLVLRFDKDRLWLYNNGRTMQENYLQALSTLGGASKKEEANTSGSFGTGFRSTHMFTDTPELEWIQWNGNKTGLVADSRFLTFQLERWDSIEERTHLPESSLMNLPAGVTDSKYDKLGVFFSFPWRQSNKTGRSEFDEYLWDEKRIEELAFEIREQSAKMLMGCRYLNKIRIILTCAQAEKNNFIFEVSSDTTLSQINISKKSNGILCLNQMTHLTNKKVIDLDSKGAWGRKNHQWYAMELSSKPKKSNRFDYSWCQKPIYQKPNNMLDDKGNVEVQTKRYWNLCVMYFPLSSGADKLPIYTPIPLGGVSKEFFGIVGFCPPAENRREIDTASDKVKRFVRDITCTAIELYSMNINRIIKTILDDKKIPPIKKEEIIIQLFPRDSAAIWLTKSLSNAITESKNTTSVSGKGITGDLWDALEKAVKNLPLACIDGEMKLLSETIHTIPKNGGNLDERLSKILDYTNRSVLNSVWSDYYSEVIESSNSTFRKYIWETFFLSGKGYIGFYGSKPVEILERFTEVISECLDDLMKNDLTTRRLHKYMIDLVNNPPGNWNQYDSGLSKLFILRDANGRLHSIDSAIADLTILIPDTGQSKLIPYIKILIGEKYLLHQNLQKESIKTLIALEKLDQLKLGSAKMVWIIDKSTELYPNEHDNLDKYPVFHEAVSNLLLNAVSSGLNRTSVRGKKFIPVLRNGKTQTLEENTLESGKLIWDQDTQVKLPTSSHGYHREFIFQTLDDDEYSSLPGILKGKLRFLNLHSSINQSQEKTISVFFAMNKAINGGKPLNLVRTLLTEQTGGRDHLKTRSLFRDKEFGIWRNQQPLHMSSKAEQSSSLQPVASSVDKDESKDKRELLIFFLKGYKANIPDKTISFKALREVPYLPTLDGGWVKPSEASTCSDEKLLNKIGNMAKGLHPDIVSELGEKILSKMGVSGSIKISQATELMKTLEGNSELSASLLNHFLLFLDFEDVDEKLAYQHYMENGPKNGYDGLRWAPEGYDKDTYTTSSPEVILWPDPKYESFLKTHFLDSRAIPESLDEERIKKAIVFFNFATEITFGHFYELLDKNERELFLEYEGTIEKLEEFQKYVSKNKVRSPDSYWIEVMSKKESIFLIQGQDGETLTAESGSIFTSSSNKSKWEPLFTKNGFINIFSHDEIIGGKGFCKQLIDCGFGTDKPAIADLIFELEQPEIEPHIAKLIWKELAKRNDDDEVLDSVQGISKLYYEHKSETFEIKSEICINNGTISPLLDSNKLVLDAGKLTDLVEKVLLQVGAMDLRKITPDQILSEAIRVRSTSVEVNELDRLRQLIIGSEQLFGLLQHNHSSYELVSDEQIQESLMLDSKKHDEYQYYLFKQRIPILCKINASYDSKLKERAILFSECNPKVLLQLKDINSTPNTLMENKIQSILMVDAADIINSNTQHKEEINSLQVKMIQSDVPKKLEFDLKGVRKICTLLGAPNAFQKNPASKCIEFLLSRDRQKCNAGSVAILVVKALIEFGMCETMDTDDLQYLQNLISSKLEEENESLFESNASRETTGSLRHVYLGCQISSCGRYTPMSDQNQETAERRKSFLGTRSTFYKWPQTVDENYPIGQNVWLCPRHHTLWERGLIRFSGLDKVPTKLEAENILPKLDTMSSNFAENTLDIVIYDGEGRNFDAKWNEEKLLTHKIANKNHGQLILQELTRWVRQIAEN